MKNQPWQITFMVSYEFAKRFSFAHVKVRKNALLKKGQLQDFLFTSKTQQPIGNGIYEQLFKMQYRTSNAHGKKIRKFVMYSLVAKTQINLSCNEGRSNKKLKVPWQKIFEVAMAVIQMQ